MRIRASSRRHDGGLDALPCACAMTRRASRAVTQLYDQWLRPHGIEGPQFALLAMLERLGESNQMELGRRFNLDKTTLSRNLGVLKRRGWIDATAAVDARERRITLTAAGRRQLATSRPAWRTAQARLRASLNGHDWDAVLRALDALTQAARNAQRPGDVSTGAEP